MSLEMIDYYLCNIQDVIYRILSQVLHYYRFQQLEALWTALDRCLDKDQQFFIMALSANEVNNPHHHHHIGKLLYDKRFNMPGEIPLAVLAIADINHPASLSLSKFIQPAFTTVISALNFDEEPLARKPYDFEEHTRYNHFIWENPIFHVIKPSLMPLKLCQPCSTDNLNMSILTSRFIHCVKILLRDAIGRFESVCQFETYLQSWIHCYCSQTQASERYPLESATIHITEHVNKNSYHCHISLQLHAQPSPTELTLPFKFG